MTPAPNSPTVEAGDGVKERPILFSAPMIKALLAGEKTQTRRVAKPRSRVSLFAREDDGRPMWSDSYILDPGNAEWLMRDNPYGKPGDRLWVRETVACGACALGKPSLWSPSFWRREQGSPANPNGLWYAADGLTPERTITERGKWTPAIHMPRWASRITLEITDIRVERLHAITEADAQAEGVEPPATERDDHDWKICPQCGGTGLHGALGANLGVMEVDCRECDTHAKRFRHLWSSINGTESWDANPFVWVVSFALANAEPAGGGL